MPRIKTYCCLFIVTTIAAILIMNAYEEKIISEANAEVSLRNAEILNTYYSIN